MISERPLFSVCIPAYNRARYLSPLLDSILSQNHSSFEVIICEDLSPERDEISEIVERYQTAHGDRIRYIQNEQNLGYDANIRNLVERSLGKFCFFMGNDDLMCPNALCTAQYCIESETNVGFVLRSYAWFDHVPTEIAQEVRYFSKAQSFREGAEAIAVCFRRAGVISGLIIDRDKAAAAATAVYDGTLYYQMHITGAVLEHKKAVFTPEILTLSRNSEPPDFGNSEREKGVYTPGVYTPEARYAMVSSVLRIARDTEKRTGLQVYDPIEADYANYFYPYIRDQLKLPLQQYWKLYRDFSRLGLGRHLLFHVYSGLGYLLGARKMDRLIYLVKKRLGRSPYFGQIR